MFQGSVDAVSCNNAVGWVYSERIGEGLRVQAVINHQVIGEGVAENFRPDLQQAGLGTGHCGFDIQFNYEIDTLYLPFVEVRLEGSSLSLPRTSANGFSDYFSALYAKYPSVGRQASVLNGLWIDRSDAPTLLKSRVDIGSVPLSNSGTISRLIQEGIVVVELVHGGGTDVLQRFGAAPAGVSNAVVKTFFDPDLIRLLRSLLDDNPVVVGSVDLEDPQRFYQISGVEDLVSPAESIGLIIPTGRETAAVEVLRGSHRLPEFQPDGVSRWTHHGADRVAALGNSGLLPIDLFQVFPGSVAIVSPGLIHRKHPTLGATAKDLLVVPARQSLARFRQKAPTGELTDRTGARFWY